MTFYGRTSGRNPLLRYLYYTLQNSRCKKTVSEVILGILLTPVIQLTARGEYTGNQNDDGYTTIG